MVSCVVGGESVSGLEVLSTHNAGVGHIQMNLGVTLYFVLVILQATTFTPPLPQTPSLYHRLQHSIQF